MSAAEIEVIEATLGEAALRETPEKRPQSRQRPATKTIAGVVTGTLIGFKDEGRTPLVTFADQPGTAALAAGAVLDLHGPHIGRKVVLMFENGDPLRPIIMGLLREQEAWPLQEQPGQVDVDVDGQRLMVSAKEQLVLKCGKASVTLTKAGKILIQGTYVSNRSSGVMRIKGGSVQLN
jgi:hypothetical protein